MDATATAETACPAARFVCAGPRPESAALGLLSGFGTILYPPDFGGFKRLPVWIISWPMGCQSIPLIGGRQRQLGSVYLQPIPYRGCSVQYVEFVDATTGSYLFSVMEITSLAKQVFQTPVPAPFPRAG
jgi:hypothetical protein